MEEWLSLPQLLCEDQIILTFDYRGTGHSLKHIRAKPSVLFNTVPAMTVFVNDVIKLCRFVAPQSRWNMLGHGFGEMIAQRIAIDAPFLLEKLVLCGEYQLSSVADPLLTVPSVFSEPHLKFGASVLAFLALARDALTTPLKDWESFVASMTSTTADIESLTYTPEWIKANPERFEQMNQLAMEGRLAFQFLAQCEFSTRNQTSLISNPTLILRGLMDRMFDAERHAFQMASLLPDARLISLPKCGFNFHVMAPHLSASYILAFLRMTVQSKL